MISALSINVILFVDVTLSDKKCLIVRKMFYHWYFSHKDFRNSSI